MKEKLFLSRKAFMLIVGIIMVYHVNNGWALPITSYTDFSSFSAISGPLTITDFDNFATGTTFTQPAIFDNVSYSFNPMPIYHQPPANFRTFNAPYNSITWPNVLAAASQLDGTLEIGTTTMSFPIGTGSAGLFSIMGRGFNSSLFATSTITAMDFGGNSFTTSMIFQGQVGEQRFIGFDSPLGISSIIFTSASHVNGFSAIAMDNVSYGHLTPIPEPSTLLLLVTGLMGLRFMGYVKIKR